MTLKKFIFVIISIGSLVSYNTCLAATESVANWSSAGNFTYSNGDTLVYDFGDLPGSTTVTFDETVINNQVTINVSFNNFGAGYNGSLDGGFIGYTLDTVQSINAASISTLASGSGTDVNQQVTDKSTVFIVPPTIQSGYPNGVDSNNGQSSGPVSLTHATTQIDVLDTINYSPNGSYISVINTFEGVLIPAPAIPEPDFPSLCAIGFLALRIAKSIKGQLRPSHGAIS